MGTLKWSPSQLTCNGLELIDSAGRKVAKFKSSGISGFGGTKELEILVPCDELLVDLIVLSGMAIRALRKGENEAAAEIIGAAVTA